jgi:hypothetical protein
MEEKAWPVGAVHLRARGALSTVYLRKRMTVTSGISLQKLTLVELGSNTCIG